MNRAINEQLAKIRSDLVEGDQLAEGRIPAKVDRHLTSLNSTIRVFEDEVRKGNSAAAHKACSEMMAEIKAMKSSIPS